MSERLADLIDKAKNLDRAAFGDIYETYVDGVYRYVYYRLFDKTDAEDLTEEIFIKAMTGIKGFSPDKGSFTGWIYAIARNTLTDHFRSKKREVAMVEDVAAKQQKVTDGGTDALVIEAVRRALAGLTAEQREVIVLRFYAGLKISEIAEHMDKRETAVKALQRRASLKLAKALGGEW